MLFLTWFIVSVSFHVGLVVSNSTTIVLVIHNAIRGHKEEGHMINWLYHVILTASSLTAASFVFNW